ncbi:MAG TPA: S1 RNA-binding domain-containing protein [Anaerolineae bacterium]|nr:S1 RNA-binding domain-containing protein [Anaerolineae bacterium]
MPWISPTPLPVYIAATDGISAKAAIAEIEKLTEEAKLGKIYTGRVVRTEKYGAFVEILPGVDGMVHISQLADYRAPSVEDVVKVGDEIMVMVIGIDESTGKIRLSRQAVLEGWSLEEAQRRDRQASSGGRSGSGHPQRRSSSPSPAHVTGSGNRGQRGGRSRKPRRRR